MLTVGAVGAVLIYGRHPQPSPATGASAEPQVVTVTSAIVAISPSAVAPASSAIPSASADTVAPMASTAPSAVAAVAKRTGGQTPPPKPSSSAPVKRGSEIRSPFD